MKYFCKHEKAQGFTTISAKDPNSAAEEFARLCTSSLPVMVSEASEPNQTWVKFDIRALFVANRAQGESQPMPEPPK